MSQTKAQLISGTSTQDVTFDDATVSSLNGGPIAGARNRIINGDMRIDQRNAGASSTPSAYTYTVDRWALAMSQSSKLTIGQNLGSVAPPSGFTNYLGASTASAYSVAAGDFFFIRQYIEGFNFSDLNWGTAQASSIVLSFKVYSSLTGNFGGVLNNGGSTRSYPFSYSIPAANTWTTVNIVIPGDTSGTWLGTNGIGCAVVFSLGAGSTYSGTAGSWSGSNFISSTGATSVVGTNGATFYITGVQLEAGSVATPFERRSYGQELSLCQRYYQVATVYIPDGGSLPTNWFFKVTMRMTPTILGGGAGYTTFNTSAECVSHRQTSATGLQLTASIEL